MALTLHVQIEFGPATMTAIRELTHAVRANTNQGKLTMKTLDDLAADVAAETAVEQSAVTLLGGLSTQIAALKSTQTDPETAAKIDALAQQIEQSSSTLAAAVAANTPAAPAAGSTDQGVSTGG